MLLCSASNMASLSQLQVFRQILSYYSATTDALFQSIKFYSLLNWKYLPYSIVCIHNGIASWRCISYFSAVCLSAALLLLFSKLCCTVHYFCLKVCSFTWAPLYLAACEDERVKLCACLQARFLFFATISRRRKYKSSLPDCSRLCPLLVFSFSPFSLPQVGRWLRSP